MESIKVSDYMNKRPVTFKEEMSLAEAVERFLNSHQMGGPVVNTARKVVGFLSEQDCLEKMLKSTYFGESHLKVKDLMHPEPLTVAMDHSVLELAQNMNTNKPKIYPVVDGDGTLVGTIGRSDVLKALDVHLLSMYEKGHPRIV